MNLLSEKANKLGRPLILDGAMGSLLQQKDVPVDSNLWMSKANIDYPETVMEIHKEYITAGADIITTNTFRANPVAVGNSNCSSEELVKAGLEIILEAKGSSDVIIAGSNPPAEDCYQKERTVTQMELEDNHKTCIDLLLKYGSDFILNETQSHWDEIKFICEYCHANNIKYVLSIFFNDELKILSGENLSDVIDFVLKYEPLAVAFNCTAISTFLKFYRQIGVDFNWGIYLNCGDGSFSDTNIKCGVSSVKYARTIKNVLSSSLLFAGACCGSSPEHIKKLKDLFDG